VFKGVVEGSSEAEFVSALRNVRIADLLDNTGYNQVDAQKKGDLSL